MKKVATSHYMSDESFEREIAAIVRRANRLRAARNGSADVIAYWRNPYRERKVREYRGHWVHVIRVRK